jgi:hypothetical protein
MRHVGFCCLSLLHLFLPLFKKNETLDLSERQLKFTGEHSEHHSWTQSLPLKRDVQIQPFMVSGSWF